MPDEAAKIDPRVYMRMMARALAIEQAAKAAGPGALPSQILEYADRFYPFIAQEVLKE